jgi:hypothetical protein
MDKIKYLIIVGIVLVNPIIYKRHGLQDWIMFLIGFGLLYVSLNVKNNSKYLWLGVWIILSSINILWSTDLLTINGLNRERTIFGDPQSVIDIKLMQREALYLPYRLRPIIFSNTVFLYKLVQNGLEFWRIGNMVNMVGIGGALMFVWGIIKIYRYNTNNFKIALGLLIVTGLVVGVNRYDVGGSGAMAVWPLVLWIQINWLL